MANFKLPGNLNNLLRGNTNANADQPEELEPGKVAPPSNTSPAFTSPTNGFAADADGDYGGEADVPKPSQPDNATDETPRFGTLEDALTVPDYGIISTAPDATVLAKTEKTQTSATHKTRRKPTPLTDNGISEMKPATPVVTVPFAAKTENILPATDTSEVAAPKLDNSPASSAISRGVVSELDNSLATSKLPLSAAPKPANYYPPAASTALALTPAEPPEPPELPILTPPLVAYVPPPQVLPFPETPLYLRNPGPPPRAWGWQVRRIPGRMSYRTRTVAQGSVVLGILMIATIVLGIIWIFNTVKPQIDLPVIGQNNSSPAVALFSPTPVISKVTPGEQFALVLANPGIVRERPENGAKEAQKLAKFTLIGLQQKTNTGWYQLLGGSGWIVGESLKTYADKDTALVDKSKLESSSSTSAPATPAVTPKS